MLTVFFRNRKVVQDVYPVWTYSYLAILLVIFIVTHFLLYKPVVVLESVCYILTSSVLIWGQGVPAMQVRFLFWKYILKNLLTCNFSGCRVPVCSSNSISCGLQHLHLYQSAYWSLSNRDRLYESSPSSRTLLGRHHRSGLDHHWNLRLLWTQLPVSWICYTSCVYFVFSTESRSFYLLSG